VAQHAGTLDLDVVIDLVVLEDTEAYRRLEDYLKKIGFERERTIKARRSTGAGRFGWKTVQASSWNSWQIIQTSEGGEGTCAASSRRRSDLCVKHPPLVYRFYFYDTAKVT
jgi:hypothetical protein